jgi:WD40 repeat protein
VQLWDVAEGSATTLAEKLAPVAALAFSPNGKVLASAGGTPDRSGGGEVRLWHLATGQGRSLTGDLSDTVSCLAFTADGRILALGSYDGTVTMRDVATGKVLPAASRH